MNILSCDFETNNSDIAIATKQTNIWLADSCDIYTYKHTTTNNLNEFLNNIYKQSPCICYFHNLKFDGMFIIDFLLKNNYTHTLNKTLQAQEFSTLITETGQFYCIKICFKKCGHHANKTVEIRDSSKKIQGTVHDIALAYKLPILKGEIDYKKHRDTTYTATPEEISYIHNDTEIIARVLNIMYSENMVKMTSASDTFSLFKSTLTANTFKVLFPVQDIDTDKYIRKSYRGGVCIVNPKIQNKILHNVNVYDVNSMYPHKMAYSELPYGNPKFYSGKYIPDKKMPLYIQRIRVSLYTKENHYPTILQSSFLGIGKNAYITDTLGAMLEFTLTSIDLQLMFENYNIEDIEYIDGYKFYSSNNLFKSYILENYKLKCNSSGAKKNLYKIKLNSLYGKFASNPKHIRKIPYLENSTVKFENSQAEYSETIYTAVSTFITAYAREQLFNAINSNYTSFIYCDTDSMHLTTTANSIPISPTELGSWDLEKTYTTAKYIAQKTYYGKTETKNDIKIAGCPKSIKDTMSLDNFYLGNTFDGKLLPKKISGGVVLIDTQFTIKDRNIKSIKSIKQNNTKTNLKKTKI